MPIPPPASPTYSALDQASDVMALARSLLGDLDAVTWQDAVLLPLVQSSYRDLQRELYIRGKLGKTYGFSVFTVPTGVTRIGDAVNAAAVAATPGGVSRVANVVTVTTTSPHGLEVGMGALLAAVVPVGATSFNGQFLVASVPNSTTFTFAQTAANDTGGGGTVTMTPALPIDFMFLEALWEKKLSSGEQYVEVGEASDTLPDFDQVAQLRYYNQGMGDISFVGATQDNQCKMKYVRGLADIATAQDYIKLRWSTDALGYMTAATGARSRGASSKEEDFTSQANREIDNLAAMYVRPKGRTAKRRRPYGYGRRSLYL